MAIQDRPGALRLLVYVIAAACLSGGIAGWVSASGAREAVEAMAAASWLHTYRLICMATLVMPQFLVISLWINQRSGRDGWRLVSSLLILLLLAGLISRVLILFGSQDASLAFLASLGLWVFALFAIAVVQHACRPAGFLLWIPFAVLTADTIINFEMMRLHTAVIGAL
ncbi:hypothetical protein [Maricaulis sp. CAU 1757]